MLGAGAETMLAAPLDRLPLVAAEGAIVITTDAGGNFSCLHDEPTRAVRIFPGPTEGSSRFVLIEDDGISVRGAATRLTFDLIWTTAEVTLAVATDGDFPLPYRHIRVIGRQAEYRPIALRGAEGTPMLVIA